MMNAEIISVGTELLLGDVTDTNTQFIARHLAALGINVYYQSSVGDNDKRLRKLLADAVDRIKAITGRIDLVHCNNSRDEFGSGADRHANFTAGTIDKTILLDVVRAAGAPVICETPEAGLADDIHWLQASVSG